MREVRQRPEYQKPKGQVNIPCAWVACFHSVSPEIVTAPAPLPGPFELQGVSPRLQAVNGGQDRQVSDLPHWDISCAQGVRYGTERRLLRYRDLGA